MQEAAQQYHRRSRRITLGQPVRLIPSLLRGEFFEEIGTTSNISREGFYFLTKREHYQEGMRLLVTLPFHSPRDRRDREYLAQVVRVELLDNGQRARGRPTPVVGRRSSVRLQTFAPCSSGARSRL
jgi:hypothetical protein